MVDYKKMNVSEAKFVGARNHVEIEGVAVAPMIDSNSNDPMHDQFSFWLYDKTGIIGVQLYREQNQLYGSELMKTMSPEEAFGTLENLIQASSQSRIPMIVKGVTYGARSIDHTNGPDDIGYVLMHLLEFDGRKIQFTEKY